MNMLATTATLTMSSLEMVEFINAERKGQAAAVGSQFPSTGYAKLEHSDFMKKVPQVLGGGAGNFSDTYVHPQNGQHYPCYRLPKREACLMAMSYSYELQAKVFDRMTALENKAAPALPNFADPVVAARAWADAKEAEQKAVAALELAAPKVEFVDRYVESQGAMTFRQVAKLLKANEAELRQFLQDKKIMYRLGAGWAAYKSHEEAGRFVTNTGVANSNAHAFTSTRFTPKGVQWIAGLWGAFKATNQLRLLA